MAVADTSYRSLCTLTPVVTEKTVILQFLDALGYGHQFRQICWYYPVRDPLRKFFLTI